MASIGLKVNHSTVGTDMASSLAKIMGSSTTDAINIARLKSELLNDEVARNAAIAADVAARQKAKRENAAYGYDLAAVDPLSQLAIDIQSGGPAAVAATEAPLPVEDPTIPIPYPRPELPATLQPEAVAATEPPEVVGEEPAYAAEPDWAVPRQPVPAAIRRRASDRNSALRDPGNAAAAARLAWRTPAAVRRHTRRRCRRRWKACRRRC